MTDSYAHDRHHLGAARPRRSAWRIDPALPDRADRVDVHLIGLGAVGRHLLWRLAASRHHRLVGVTDSSASLRARGGIDPLAILPVVENGGQLVELDEAVPMPGEIAVDYVRADVVLDAAPADGRWRYHGVARAEAALRRGARVVMLAAGPIGARAHEWFRAGQAERLWCSVPMDGVWTRLRADRQRLAGASSVVVVGDPRSSAWLDAVARGERPPEVGAGNPGLALAHRLAVAVEAVRGVEVDPRSIHLPLLEHCDTGALRDQHARGRVTRLVGRWSAEDGARVDFEALGDDGDHGLGPAIRSPAASAVAFAGGNAGRVVLVGRSAHADARHAAVVAWGDLVACCADVQHARRRARR